MSAPAVSSRRRLAIACAAAGFLLAGLCLALSPAALIDALDGAATGDHRRSLLEGARLLRALVALQAVLALAIAAWLARTPRTVHRRGPAAALWQPSPPPPPVSTRECVAVGAAVATALALRLIGLDSGLWMDEVFTLTEFVRLPASVIVTRFPHDNQHLLYSLLAHASIAAFGESAATLRLPALLFGAASLLAIWRLGRLVLDVPCGIASASLFALSSHHVWFSQNARGYTGLLLATLLATELLLRALWRGRARIWFAYAIVIALGMSVHLTCVFVPLAHALVIAALALRAHRRGVRVDLLAPLVAFSFAGLATLTLHALVLPQMLAFFLSPGAGSTTAVVEWKSPLWLLSELFRRLGVGTVGGTIGVAGSLVILAPGVLWFVRRDATVTGLFALPPLLGAAVLIALGRNLWPRFFFHEAGFVVLGAVHGALRAGGLIAPRLLAAPRAMQRALRLLPVVVLLAAAAAGLPRTLRVPKQDFEGARDYVRALAGPADRIVPLDVSAEVYARLFAPEWEGARDRTELAARLAPGGRTFVLYTLPRYLASTQPDLAAWLEQDFRLLRVFDGTLGDGAIFVRVREPRAAPETRRATSVSNETPADAASLGR